MRLCHQFEANAYRTLGVSAASTSTQILQCAQGLRRATMLGVEGKATDCFGRILRDEAAIRAAVGSLSDPRERLRHRLLWFHGPVCLEPAHCAGAWPKLSAWEAEHDHALLGFAGALLAEDLARMVNALRAWQSFLSKAQYWEYLADSETRENFEPAANAAEIEALRKQAMALTAEPLACSARHAWSQKDHAAFRAHLAGLRQLEDSGSWAAACREELLFPLTRRLADVCHTVEKQYRSRVDRRDAAADANRIVCAAELDYYRQQVEPSYRDIAGVVPEEEEEARVARGQTADLLHFIALDHTWADEFDITAELAVEALRMAAGTIEEPRIRSALEKYAAAGEETLKRKPLQQAIATWNEAVAAFDEHFASLEETEPGAALSHYREFLEPLLGRLLDQFLEEDGLCREWRSQAAVCLERTARSFAAAEEFTQAEELIAEAVKLAAGTAALAGLQQSLGRIKDAEAGARARKAELAAQQEAVNTVRQHCRTLAVWSEMVREDEAFMKENWLVAQSEILFFRSRLIVALQQVAHLSAWHSPATGTLRDEVAYRLMEIAVHHSWAGEPGKAQALMQEAFGLAAGTAAVEAMRQSFQQRQHPAPPLVNERAKAPAPRKSRRIDPFAPTPLFDTYFFWLIGVVIVLALTVAGSHAGLKRVPLKHGPGGPPGIQTAPPPSKPTEQTGSGQADANEASRRALLDQIHQLDRAAQQMAKQLGPLGNEIAGLQSGPLSTPSARDNLEAKQRIYQQLLLKRSSTLSQERQLQRTYDRLAGSGLPLNPNKESE